MALPPFQRLLDENSENVYRFLVAQVGAQDADDCFQETFASALDAYPRLRRSDNLRGWLLKIAHHKAIDAMRGRGRRPVPSELVDERPAPAAADGNPEWWEAVRELPPKQRAAVTLRFTLDLRYAELGSVIGCSED